MLSVVILTKNEGGNIRRCIESLLWCDEIVVVDDFSRDGTIEKISNFHFPISNAQAKIKIFQRYLNGDFSAQRNFGLSKASGEWVLFVDADEVASDALASEISSAVADQISNVQGFYIKRRDIMWGNTLNHGEVGDVRILRLARKNAGVWKRRVHEYWDIEGKTVTLKNPLFHYPHQTLREFISEINVYSALHAQQKFEDGQLPSVFKILFWPNFKFIKNYFMKLGFLDGTGGFVHAMMLSFHSFLAWSKLWLLQKRKF